MKIKIHELASKEFEEAAEWYELQSKALGKRFSKLVFNQIKKIKKNPGWFPSEARNIYTAYIPKFPYKLLFSIENDNIIIL